ncbi:hypothetical protein AALP_AA5G073400 [Arabis alpina]|uniref:Uncharacterized protein n=1 Tax=Arabis alpina TaxID=50452 RepID=A0A087GVI7_ARAAL|nr:hypothetical protein AALP_AA5G073400 [Arabis alpina]
MRIQNRATMVNEFFQQALDSNTRSTEKKAKKTNKPNPVMPKNYYPLKRNRESDRSRKQNQSKPKSKIRKDRKTTIKQTINI